VQFRADFFRKLESIQEYKVQGLSTNRNSLLGSQAEPGDTTGPPTCHRECQAGGKPKQIKKFVDSDLQTISNHMKQSKWV
jgi:hypothetical protein